jgi:hypothetical protein
MPDEFEDSHARVEFPDGWHRRSVSLRALHHKTQLLDANARTWSSARAG